LLVKENFVLMTATNKTPQAQQADWAAENGRNADCDANRRMVRKGA
jgi:hypothetical protein